MLSMMMKKQLNLISAATCFVFTIVIVIAQPGLVFAADEDTGSTDSVRSEVEPLPFIIVGALVLFAGLIVFDVIFHPYEEKKDDEKKPVHAKVPDTKTIKSQQPPKYSTDYDYLLGMSVAQVSQQLPVQLKKAIPK
jgi:hypothetical protein